MDSQRLESRVLAIADAVLAGRPVEDDRVELKTVWPPAGHKTARQIAGHANASGGEPILWIIGLNEGGRAFGDVSDTEPADWWAATGRWFDDVSPELHTLVVAVRPGKHVMALQFSSERAPYLVATKDGGQVQREVPWRTGNSTRTAHRHEILRSVVAEATVPTLELIRCEVVLSEYVAKDDNGLHDYDDAAGNPLKPGAYELRCDMEMFLSANTPANLPEHRQNLVAEASTTGPITFGSFDLAGPFRYGGYSQSGGRTRQPAGAITILGRSGVVLNGSGELSLNARKPLDQETGVGLQRARRMELRLRMPVDRTERAATLTERLVFVVGSAEDPANRPEYERWVVRARFGVGTTHGRR
jgi:hypothetical protein